MGKLGTYLMLMTGIVLLFYFGGLLENTATSTLLSLALNPESLETSSLATKITTFIGIAIAVGATLLAAVQKSDFVIFAPFATVLLSYAWDFISIFQKVAAANYYLAVLFFSPLMIVYILSVAEWWRGIST